jgi:hypothetical protein
MLVCYALRGPAVASDPLDPRCEAEEWKASWFLGWLWLLRFSTCRWGVPPNSVLLLDVLCTCVSARREPRRLFRLLGPLGVWRTELSELLCDSAAWFPAFPELLSVVCRYSWLGVCSAAASRPRDSANCGVAALFMAASLWPCFRKFSDEVVAGAEGFYPCIRCSRPRRRRPLYVSQT